MLNIKEKLITFMFAAFYIILFPLQMLPCLIVVFVGTTSVWFWITLALSLIAMIVQNVKFPCVGSRLWSAGAVMGLIAAIWYVRLLTLQAGAG